MKFTSDKQKPYIIKITHKDSDYWKGVFINNKTSKGIVSYDILERGVYKMHNINNIDEKYDTRYTYIDPINDSGGIIKASIIDKILNKDLSYDEVLKINNQ